MSGTAQKSLLKVVVLGDAGVGKTSIVKQYVENFFDDEYKPTIGADFLTKDMTLPEQRNITLQIWDTAGQERFKSMAVSFYRGADACVLCYDITDPRSFHNLEMWMQEFVDNAGTEIDKQKFPFIVLGNKADKEADRQIGKPRAEAWCKGKNNIPLFETSAVSKLNLDEAFDLIAQAAGRGESIPSVALSNVNDLEKKQADDGDEQVDAADPGDDGADDSKPKSKSKIKRADNSKKGRRTSAQVGSSSPRHKKRRSQAPRTLASDDSDTDPTDSSDDGGGGNTGDKRGRSKRDADRPSRRSSPNDEDYGRPQHSNASSVRGRRRGQRRSVSPDGTINLDRNSYFSGSSDMERQNCCGVTF